MTNRLLITGGTGFFGRALLRHLHAHAAQSKDEIPLGFSEVIVVSRKPEAFANFYPDLASAPWLTWVQADICDRNSLSSIESLGPIDAVLHAATDSTDANSLTPLEQYDQIVGGTRNILELSIRLNAKRFLLTSSGGVYGPQPSDMEEIPETYHGAPNTLCLGSTYGLGKRMAEHLCFLYSQRFGLETVIARCFAFVGQDLPMEAHFAIGNFIRDALHKRIIEVGGDGMPIRSYMDQRDLSRWLLILLNQGRPGEAYNVGSDDPITIRDLAYLVRDTLAPQKAVHITGKAPAQTYRNRYVPCIAKAKVELNLTLNYSLRESIYASSTAVRALQLT